MENPLLPPWGEVEKTQHMLNSLQPHEETIRRDGTNRKQALVFPCIYLMPVGSWVQHSPHRGNRGKQVLCYLSARRYTPTRGLWEGSRIPAGGVYLSPRFRTHLIAADSNKPPGAIPMPASSKNSTTADNRLIWQSIQTLEPKQSWQLSTRKTSSCKPRTSSMDGLVCRGFRKSVFRHKCVHLYTALPKWILPRLFLIVAMSVHSSG